MNEEEIDEEEWDRRLAQVMGPAVPRVPPTTTRSLDDLFASRTHVRVLRALVEIDWKLNLTVRGVARRVETSHGRVLQVLEHLSSLGIVTAHRAPSHAVYQLNDRHLLIDAIRSLFDEERRIGETKAR